MPNAASQELTDRQVEILDYIRTFPRANGFAPTVREIGEGTGISSPNGVVSHLKALERKGRLAYSASGGRNLTRSIRVLGDEEPTAESIVQAVAKKFRCFGKTTVRGNPIADAMVGKAPQFAAGVDVAAVVRFVLSFK